MYLHINQKVVIEDESPLPTQDYKNVVLELHTNLKENTDFPRTIWAIEDHHVDIIRVERVHLFQPSCHLNTTLVFSFLSLPSYLTHNTKYLSFRTHSQDTRYKVYGTSTTLRIIIVMSVVIVLMDPFIVLLLLKVLVLFFWQMLL